MTVAAAEQVKATYLRSRYSRPAWAAGCFVFFLLVYGVTARADVQVSDEAAMLATGAQLDEHGNLYIDNLRWLQEDVNIGMMGVGGHLYSKYFAGNTFGAALLYRLGAHLPDRPYIWNIPAFGAHELVASASGARLALRLNAILGALGLTALYLLVETSNGHRAALATTLLFGLSTDWWYQSRGFFSEVGAGAFMLAALYAAIRRRPYWFTFFLGIAALFRPTSLVALPVWILALRRDRFRDLLSGFYIALSLALMAYFNWIRFGNVADFGYGTAGFKTPVVIGLIGVLLSPGRSLFFYSPLLILVFTGGVLLYKQDRRLALPVVGIGLAYLVIAAGWQNWWGGKAWGSRLLTPILPMLGVLIGAAVNSALQFARTRLRVTILALSAIGLCIQLLTISENPVTVLDRYIASGYSSDAQSVMSVDKNWLALELKNLPNTSPCTLDAYTLRSLFPACGQ